MSTPQTLINQAMFNLGAVAAGETPNTSESADGFIRLNQMLGNWSAEGVTVFNQVQGLYALQAGVIGYTLGTSGATWATAGRPYKITAWRALFGDMVKGGAPLSMAEFGMAASAYQQQLAEIALRATLEGLTSGVTSPLAAPIPTLVGADTNYPNINVRVAPVPSNAGGQIELSYWAAIPSFVTLGDTVTLPLEFEEALHFNLAVALESQYSKTGGIDPVLAANAQRTKAAIVQLHTMQSQAPQQPQQQQQQ